MYKHKNEGKGTITVTDDEGNHHAFVPGQIIVLNRVYTRFEIYGIVCKNADEQKAKPVKKAGKTIVIEEEGDDI